MQLTVHTVIHYTGYTQNKCAASKLNEKFIYHLTQSFPAATPSWKLAPRPRSKHEKRSAV